MRNCGDYIKHILENEKIANINLLSQFVRRFPTGIYLFKVHSGNTKTRGEVCSKSTMIILE